MTPEQIAAMLAAQQGGQANRAPARRPTERYNFDPAALPDLSGADPLMRTPDQSSPAAEAAAAAYRRWAESGGFSQYGMDTGRLQEWVDPWESTSRGMGALVEGRNPLPAMTSNDFEVDESGAYRNVSPTMDEALIDRGVNPVVAILADALLTPDATGVGRAADLVPLMGLLGAPGLRKMLSGSWNDVDFMPAGVLHEARGNELRRSPARQSEFRRGIDAEGGFNEPAIVMFDPKSGRWKVGEGNHRVFAALEADSPVPVRVVKGTVAENEGLPLPEEGRAALARLAETNHGYSPSSAQPGQIGLPAYEPETVLEYAARQDESRMVPWSPEDEAEMRGLLQQAAEVNHVMPRSGATLTRSPEAQRNFTATIQRAAQDEGFDGEAAEWVQMLIDELGPQRGLDVVRDRTGLTGLELRETLAQWTEAYDVGRENMSKIPDSFRDPEFNAAADLARAELELGKPITGRARSIIQNPDQLRAFGQVYDTMGPEGFWEMLRNHDLSDDDIRAIEAALGGPGSAAPPPRKPDDLGFNEAADEGRDIDIDETRRRLNEERAELPGVLRDVEGRLEEARALVNQAIDGNPLPEDARDIAQRLNRLSMRLEEFSGTEMIRSTIDDYLDDLQDAMPDAFPSSGNAGLRTGVEGAAPSTLAGDLGGMANPLRRGQLESASREWLRRFDEGEIAEISETEGLTRILDDLMDYMDNAGVDEDVDDLMDLYSTLVARRDDIYTGSPPGTNRPPGEGWRESLREQAADAYGVDDLPPNLRGIVDDPEMLANLRWLYDQHGREGARRYLRDVGAPDGDVEALERFLMSDADQYDAGVRSGFGDIDSNGGEPPRAIGEGGISRDDLDGIVQDVRNRGNDDFWRRNGDLSVSELLNNEELRMALERLYDQEGNEAFRSLLLSEGWPENRVDEVEEFLMDRGSVGPLHEELGRVIGGRSAQGAADALGTEATERLSNLVEEIEEFTSVLDADMMTDRTVAEADRLYAEITSMIEDIQPIVETNNGAAEASRYLEDIRTRISQRVDPTGADSTTATVADVVQEITQTTGQADEATARAVEILDSYPRYDDVISPEHMSEMQNIAMELDVSIGTLDEMLRNHRGDVPDYHLHGLRRHLEELTAAREEVRRLFPGLD